MPATVDGARFAESSFGPGGYADTGDVGEGSVAPARLDVSAQAGAVVLLSADVYVEGRQPIGDPGVERAFAAGGVDEGAAALLGFDVGGVVFCVGLGREAGDRADRAVVFEVAHSPGVRTGAVNPCHSVRPTHVVVWFVSVSMDALLAPHIKSRQAMRQFQMNRWLAVTVRAA